MVQLILLLLAFVLALIESVRGWLVPATFNLHLGWLAVALALLAFVLGSAGVR